MLRSEGQFKILLAHAQADIVKSEETLRELKTWAKYLRKRLNNAEFVKGQKVLDTADRLG